VQQAWRRLLDTLTEGHGVWRTCPLENPTVRAAGLGQCGGTSALLPPGLRVSVYTGPEGRVKEAAVTGSTV